MCRNLIYVVNQDTDKYLLDGTAAIHDLMDRFETPPVVVCFDDSWYVSLSKTIPKIIKWNDTLSYEACLQNWSAAYSSIQKMTDRSFVDIGSIFQIYQHSLSDSLLKFMMVEHVLKIHKEGVIIVTSDGGRALYNLLEAGVILQSGLIKEQSKFIVKMFQKSIARITFKTDRRPRNVGSTSSQAQVIVVVEDSQSFVNYSSARHVVADLNDKNIPVKVISSNLEILSRFKKDGCDVEDCKSSLVSCIGFRYVIEIISLWRSIDKVIANNHWSSAEIMLLRSIKGKLFKLVAFKNSSLISFKKLSAKNKIKSMLVVNESSPLAIIGVNWLRGTEVISYGLWPALIGERPDYKNFPADRHLVYGDHIKEYLISNNVELNKIDVVGSPAYDSLFALKRSSSIKIVKEKILKKWDSSEQKLVIIATEAMQNPLEEISPILTQLADLNNVVIVLKIHPSDSSQFYKNFLNQSGLLDRVVMVDHTPFLSELLQAADLLICVNSNIIVAAAILGTMTLVCDFGGKRRALDFVGMDFCHGCFKVDELDQSVFDMLYDQTTIEKSEHMVKYNLEKFNGMNDALSAQRVTLMLTQGTGVLEQ